MQFLLPDLHKYLWLKFPAIIFLGDECGGEERNHMVLALRLIVVLQLLGTMCDGISLR